MDCIASNQAEIERLNIEMKSKEKLLKFYFNEITKLKISLQEKDAEIAKRKNSYDDLVARLEEEVKEKNALKTARYIYQHGPMLDENDLKAINTPTYKCLKNDVINPEQVKMVSLTSYGKEFLEHQGVVVDKFGKAKKIKLDNDNDWKEVSLQENVMMRTLGMNVSSVIEKYYTPPSNLSSKRSSKKAKREISNYVGQAWYGYHTGDRKKFAELEVKINNLSEVDKKQDHFVIFQSIKEVMDDMSDRSVPGPNCW